MLKDLRWEPAVIRKVKRKYECSHPTFQWKEGGEHSYFLFSSRITAASHLKFGSLALSVWLLLWYVYSIGKSLFTGRLRISLVSAILNIAPFILLYPY